MRSDKMHVGSGFYIIISILLSEETFLLTTGTGKFIRNYFSIRMHNLLYREGLVVKLAPHPTTY
jgi:hypothetical protein